MSAANSTRHAYVDDSQKPKTTGYGPKVPAQGGRRRLDIPAVRRMISHGIDQGRQVGKGGLLQLSGFLTDD